MPAPYAICANHARALYAEGAAGHCRQSRFPGRCNSGPGGHENAVRPCFIDLPVVYRLRALAEARRPGRHAAASGCSRKARTGRGRSPGRLHLQRWVGFAFAGRLPGRHGARTASAAHRRTGADRCPAFHRRSADRFGALSSVVLAKAKARKCRVAATALTESCDRRGTLSIREACGLQKQTAETSSQPSRLDCLCRPAKTGSAANSPHSIECWAPTSKVGRAREVGGYGCRKSCALPVLEAQLCLDKGGTIPETELR
jgi:hypothetical protein